MQQHALDMIANSKKAPLSCLTLLGRLADMSFHAVGRSRAIPIEGPFSYRVFWFDRKNFNDLYRLQKWDLPYVLKGIRHSSITSHLGPYVQGRLVDGERTGKNWNYWSEKSIKPPSSDTYALSSQGRGGFGSVVKAKNKLDNRIYAGTFLHIMSIKAPLSNVTI